MDKERQADNLRQEAQIRHYDLSEESSKRPEGEEATIAARQAESDDLGDGSGGDTTSSSGGFFGESRVSTSLSDE